MEWNSVRFCELIIFILLGDFPTYFLVTNSLPREIDESRHQMYISVLCTYRVMNAAVADNSYRKVRSKKLYFECQNFDAFS